VTVEGIVKARPAKSTSGDFTFDVETARGVVRVAADGSAGIPSTAFSAGDRLRLSGVAGQHASRKGALDGYRIWLRDPSDVVRLAGAAPSGSPASGPGSGPSSSPSSSGAPAPAVISIAAAIRARSGAVRVEGTVIADATLLDTTGRRIVIQDRTAAIEVVLPATSGTTRIGIRLRVAGEIGRAYGAPRIRATLVTAIVGAGALTPIELRVAPGTAHEWRLVRVRGDVVDVRKLGDRWRAEVLVAGQRIPVSGLTGARIPSTTLVEGHRATIVGIVRRPYPSATDRRFAIVPRNRADITLGSSSGGGSTPSGGTGGAVTGGTSAVGSTSAPNAGPGTTGSTADAPLDIDLAEIRDHVGTLVRVGGLVGEVRSDGFALDDGTALGRVVLIGAALAELPPIETGDALNAIGVVQAGGDPASAGVAGVVVAVSDPAGIVRVGDPIGEAPSGSPSDGPSVPIDPTVADDPTMHRASGLLDANLPDVGIAGILLAALASLAVTLLRRHRMRRRLAARVARRLSAIVPAPPSTGR
jgi:hypothetical protein